MLSSRRAFSLLELLVVIAIGTILLGLLLAVVQRVRARVQRLECAGHLAQLGMSLHQYHDIHGALPPGCSYQNGAAPQPFMSWCARLLPFLEQDALWQQTLQAYIDEPIFAVDPPHTGLATVIPAFACPADSRTLSANDLGGFQVALTAYLGVEGINQWTRDGALYLDSRVRMVEFTDGTSNTLMVGERPPSADLILGWWYAGWGQDKDGSADMVLGVNEQNAYSPWCGRRCAYPGPFEFGAGRTDNQCDAYHFWSLHPGGANFLFADGSVHFLEYSAAPVMAALATRAGGEVVTIPE